MTLERFLKQLKQMERGGILPRNLIKLYVNYHYVVFKNHISVEEIEINRDMTIQEFLKLEFINTTQEAKEIFENDIGNYKTFTFFFADIIGEEENGNSKSVNFTIMLY